MKCPSCGGEIGNGKVCQFCNSQIPYSMQREQELINKSGCPKCSSSNITFKRENQGEVRGKNYKKVIHRTVGFCKDCGYTWYPKVDNNNVSQKKNNTWLWVLGWIFIFPLPLTILMFRNKNLKSEVKYGVIAVAWVVYFLIALAGRSNNNTDTNNNATTVQEQITNDEDRTSESSTSENDNLSDTASKTINDIVDGFNSKSDIDMIFVEDFIPSDKSSGHYRTEFRLDDYNEAIGKSYSYDGATVDIVAHTTSMGSIQKRIYMDGVTLQQCEDVIKYTSSLMDNSASESDVNETISYINENKEANGYYFADKLGLVLLKQGEDLYEFMLKYE